MVSITLGLILPIRPVYAGWKWWETILGTIGLGPTLLIHGFTEGAADIATGLIGGLFQILVAITKVFAFVCQSLLNWVTSEGFINVSFTGQDNTFVNLGWGIIRDLTNMLIVLGLVIIALATILRISSYQAKKTLPLLLIIALLVNFSPVICGLIIDGTNITMNYFLKSGALKTGFIEQASEQLNKLGEAIKEGEGPAVALGKGLVFVGFNIIGGLIFLLYAFLFLFRYIALWMLVILSPIAFFCYIFPFTKKYWTMWWNQFFQWTIIGIPAAFSIYIANQMIVLINANGLVSEPTGALSGYAMIMGYIVPIAFLAVGLHMSLQTGAAGADIAIKGFQWTKGKTWAGTKWAGKKLSRKPQETAGKGLGMAGGVVGGAGKWMMERKSKAGRIAAGIFGGYALRGIGYGTEFGGAKLEAGAVEAYQRDVDKAKAKAKGATPSTKRAMQMSPFPSVRIGATQAAVEDGNIKELRETRGLENKEIEKILKETLRILPSLFKDLKDAFPGLSAKIAAEEKVSLNEALAKQAGVFIDAGDIKRFGTLAEKIRATVKPSKMENWTGGEMEAALRSTAFHENMTPNQIRKLAETFGGKFFAEWKDQVKPESWYDDNNIPAAKYIRSSAGQGLGIGFGPKERKEPGSPSTPPEAEKAEKETVTGGARQKPTMDIEDMEKDKQTGTWGMKKRRKKDTGE